MNDSDETLSIRDKIALEVLHALIARIPSKESPYSDPLKFFLEYWDAKDHEQNKYANERMEHMVRTAYRIADIVRRVRLSAFE